MAAGRKTGGRKAGTPNKATSEEASIFQELGGMRGEVYARKLHELVEGNDPNIRAKAIQIIAPYLWRKLPESHEISGPKGGGIPIVTHNHVQGEAPKHE